MASYSPVRSVERCFQILELMNKSKVSSIADLHVNTRLPKATIVRLLQTMEQLGYVTRDPRHSEYQLTSRVASLSSGFHSDPLVVEAGRIHAIAITKKLRWPTTIAILDGHEVVVRFSTIPDSPISPFHATVNMRLSLDRHALGLAYLGFCPPHERQILLKSLFDTGDRDTSVHNRSVTMLRQRLGIIRKQGFSERELNTGHENSNTLAVPIIGANRVLGTLGSTYFRSALKRSEAIKTFLEPLQTSAREIAKNVADLT
jgi:IclR family mhp operon transcriptional activator